VSSQSYRDDQAIREAQRRLRLTCGCCGTVTTPPTPCTDEEGYYCEGCGTAWVDPQVLPPNSCSIHKEGTPSS